MLMVNDHIPATSAKIKIFRQKCLTLIKIDQLMVGRQACSSVRIKIQTIIKIKKYQKIDLSQHKLVSKVSKCIQQQKDKN
jgi:hypothetical protein